MWKRYITRVLISNNGEVNLIWRWPRGILWFHPSSVQAWGKLSVLFLGSCILLLLHGTHLGFSFCKLSIVILGWMQEAIRNFSLYTNHCLENGDSKMSLYLSVLCSFVSLGPAFYTTQRRLLCIS